MALSVVQRGNQARMIRSIPQITTILEDPYERFNMRKAIETGLDKVTAAEMAEYLKSQLAEIETMI